MTSAPTRFTVKPVRKRTRKNIKHSLKKRRRWIVFRGDAAQCKRLVRILMEMGHR